MLKRLRSTCRRGNERGSVLILMPCAVLIVIILGAIAVDLAAVRLGQRDLQAAATDAANDAVTAGLDEWAFRIGAGYRLDPALVNNAAVRAIGSKGLLGVLDAAPEVTINLDGSVSVRLRQRVPHIFGRAIPGTADDTVVNAVATAHVRQR
jgi:hypothetical protein